MQMDGRPLSAGTLLAWQPLAGLYGAAFFFLGFRTGYNARHEVRVRLRQPGGYPVLARRSYWVEYQEALITQ